MILHTVKQSPFISFSLQDCLLQLGKDDLLLLISDAVIAATATGDWSDALIQLEQSNRLFVLNDDLEARGLTHQYGHTVNYADFVSLSIQCQSHFAW